MLCRLDGLPVTACEVLNSSRIILAFSAHPQRLGSLLRKRGIAPGTCLNGSNGVQPEPRVCLSKVAKAGDRSAKPRACFPLTKVRSQSRLCPLIATTIRILTPPLIRRDDIRLRAKISLRTVGRAPARARRIRRNQKGLATHSLFLIAIWLCGRPCR